MLTTVTVTGADDLSDISGLEAICDRYPFAEIGVLYGGHGPAPRFPSPGWLAELAASRCPFAIHLCARAMIESGLGGGWPAVISGIELAWERARRIQLNFHGHRSRILHDPVKVARGMTHPALAGRPVIFQLDGQNDALCGWAAQEYPQTSQLLVDRSHGGGLVPQEWPAPPFPHIRTGYAGGLAPDTVASALRLVNPAAPSAQVTSIPAIHPDASWVDAETRLMSAGRFSLLKADLFLGACLPFVAQATL